MKSGHLLHVDVEGSLRLALRTRSRLHLLSLRLEKRPQHKAALVTVVLDHAELREHASAAADHAAGPDQLVQVELPGPHRQEAADEEKGSEREREGRERGKRMNRRPKQIFLPHILTDTSNLQH